MKKLILSLVLIISFFGTLSAALYAPTLTSPTNGATGQMPNVFLVWTAVPGAFSYKIEVSVDSTFLTAHKYITNLTAINASELLFDTKYFWRVKAIGVNDSSNWSSVGKFYTVKTVTIIRPSDSAGNRALRMFFKWNAITGISKYEYEIDTAITFDSPLYVRNYVASNRTETYSKELTFGKHYYLRMRALHNADTSEWSNVLNVFTLDSFALKKPANASIKDTLNTRLEWKWVGASKYQYALSFDSAFNAVQYFTVDTTKTIYSSLDTLIRVFTDTLFFGQKYYWKVRAFNSLDTSKWSDVRYFTTIDKVKITLPANNATGISTLTTFKWDKITGIAHYVLEIDTSNAFTHPRIYQIENSATTFTIPTGQALAPFKKHYWRMKAYTSFDSSDWSNVFNFTTTSPVSVEDIEFKDAVNIFPNPSTNGKIFININAKNPSEINISVINMVGQEIFSENNTLKQGNNTITLNLTDQENGIYFIKLKNSENTLTRKVVIKK